MLAACRLCEAADVAMFPDYLVRLGAEGFLCPCHRSLFDLEGKSVDGPSPRPLDRLECKTERGRALVRFRRFRPGVRTPEPLDA